MKIHLQTRLALGMLLVAYSPTSQAASSGGAATNWVVQHFHEVDTLLANPGQGWMSQSRSSRSSPRFPGEHPVSESFQLPAMLESGEYMLAVGVMDPNGQRPPLSLAIDAPENDGRYSVSRLTIK